jgi:hypothetical protein
MTLAAVASSASTSISLADAVAELLVLQRNDAGGRCLWCHSSELQATVVPGRGGEIVVVCRTCGSELRGDVTAVAGRRA